MSSYLGTYVADSISKVRQHFETYNRYLSLYWFYSMLFVGAVAKTQVFPVFLRTINTAHRAIDVEDVHD